MNKFKLNKNTLMGAMVLSDADYIEQAADAAGMPYRKALLNIEEHGFNWKKNLYISVVNYALVIVDDADNMLCHVSDVGDLEEIGTDRDEVEEFFLKQMDDPDAREEVKTIPIEQLIENLATFTS